MNICVTGGLGYIGRHIVDRLCSQGHKVLVIDQNSYGKLTPFLTLKYPNINIHIDNIFDMDLPELFKENQIESVIHLASETSVCNTVKPLVNILGLGSYVFKSAKLAHVKTFVHASSAAAGHTGISFDNSIGYGGAKLALERLINTQSTYGDMKSFNLRLHNPYGHSHSLPFSDHKESLWFNLVNCIETGDTLKLTTRTGCEKGTAIRDWINIFDVTDIFTKFATMNHDNTVKRDYWDVGTGIGLSAYLFTTNYITVEDISVSINFVGFNPQEMETSVSDSTDTYEYINFRSKVGPRIYSNSYLNGVYST